MNKPDDPNFKGDQKKRPADASPIPSRPEDTDASGDALNGTGEDNHHKS